MLSKCCKVHNIWLKTLAYQSFKHPDLIALIIFLKFLLIVKLLGQTFELSLIINNNIPMHTVYHTSTCVSNNVNFTYQLVNIL